MVSKWILQTSHSKHLPLPFCLSISNPPQPRIFFNQKNDLESVLHWKMHQPSTKFPYATKMPKKSLLTEPRSISSRRSSLLSSANSFIQRSSGRGELLTGAPRTPKFWDENWANATKFLSEFIVSDLQDHPKFWVAKKKMMLQKWVGFFHLQWSESLPNLDRFCPPFRPDAHPALFSLPGRTKKTSAKSTPRKNWQLAPPK